MSHSVWSQNRPNRPLRLRLFVKNPIRIIHLHPFGTCTRREPRRRRPASHTVAFTAPQVDHKNSLEMYGVWPFLVTFESDVCFFSASKAQIFPSLGAEVSSNSNREGAPDPLIWALVLA